jgi:hypothetical protein
MGFGRVFSRDDFSLRNDVPTHGSLDPSADGDLHEKEMPAGFSAGMTFVRHCDVTSADI